jgi:hypothetical protein
MSQIVAQTATSATLIIEGKPPDISLDGSYLIISLMGLPSDGTIKIY